MTVPRIEDNLEIIDTTYGGSSLGIPLNRRNYAIGGDSDKVKQEHDIVFSEEIGLAIERPANGMSLE